MAAFAARQLAQELAADLEKLVPRPEEALSDGPQSLKPSKFAQLMRELRPVAEAVGRSL